MGEKHDTRRGARSKPVRDHLFVHLPSSRKEVSMSPQMGMVLTVAIGDPKIISPTSRGLFGGHGLDKAGLYFANISLWSQLTWPSGHLIRQQKVGTEAWHAKAYQGPVGRRLIKSAWRRSAAAPFTCHLVAWAMRRRTGGKLVASFWRAGQTAKAFRLKSLRRRGGTPVRALPRHVGAKDRTPCVFCRIASRYLTSLACGSRAAHVESRCRLGPIWRQLA